MEFKIEKITMLQGDRGHESSSSFFLRFYLKNAGLPHAVDTKVAVGCSEVVWNQSFCIEWSHIRRSSRDGYGFGVTSASSSVQEQEIVFELRKFRKRRNPLAEFFSSGGTQTVGRAEISVKELLSSADGCFPLKSPSGERATERNMQQQTATLRMSVSPKQPSEEEPLTSSVETDSLALQRRIYSLERDLCGCQGNLCCLRKYQEDALFAGM